MGFGNYAFSRITDISLAGLSLDASEVNIEKLFKSTVILIVHQKYYSSLIDYLKDKFTEELYVQRKDMKSDENDVEVELYFLSSKQNMKDDFNKVVQDFCATLGSKC